LKITKGFGAWKTTLAIGFGAKMSNTKISTATRTTPLATDLIPLARIGSSAALSTRFQDISAVGTITTGTWRGTTIATSYGGTGVTTSTGSGANVLGTSPTLTTPAISGGTINNSVIGGTTPAAATVMSLTLGGYTNNKKIYQSADNYITILNGNPLYSDVTIDSGGSLGVRGNLTVYGSGSSIPGYLTTAVAASTYQPTIDKGAANGYAGLDANSRILSSTLPNIPAVALALAGSLTSASHRNSEVFLSGVGALTVGLASYTTGTICVARNTTNAAVLISTNGYTTAQVGPPNYGFTSISPGGCATFLAGSSDGGTTTFLDVRGDLQ
jgi:hypothetical protein